MKGIFGKLYKRMYYFGGKLFKEDQYNQNIKNGILIMGEHSYGMPEIRVHKGDKNKVYIGKYCSIADDVKIFVGGNHRPDWISTFPFRVKFDLSQKYEDGQPYSKGDVIIGNDVWIGYNALILSGVKIGHGAIVAANSVVTKDVPPYHIVAGNPGRIMKKRFSDEEIEKLLLLNWWDWKEEKILSNVELLSSNNISDFISKYQL